MAKTYTCDLCPGTTFEGHSALKRHEKYDNDHARALKAKYERDAAASKVREELEGAQRVWKFAHGARIGGWDTVKEATEVHGLNETLAYALYNQNDRLADSARQLSKEAERLCDTMQRDVIARLADGGVQRIYGTATQTSSMHDVQVKEGEVVGRREALGELSRALGVRCQSVFAQDEWTFLETVAQFAVEVVATDEPVVLVNTAYGVREQFATHDAAVLECVRRVRLVAEQTRAAMAVKK